MKTPKENRESVISFHHPKKIEKINSNKGYELISHQTHHMRKKEEERKKKKERKVGGDAYLKLGQGG